MRKKFRYHHKVDGWVYIDFIEDNIAKAMEGYEYRPHCSQLFQYTGFKSEDPEIGTGEEVFEGDTIEVTDGDGWVVGTEVVTLPEFWVNVDSRCIGKVTKPIIL